MKEKTILNLICKWRAELMGAAILWVVLFHAGFQFRGVFFDTVQAIGYGGVDIFFLLSGIGLYYSLKKSDELLLFYKRRARRIFPSYLPFILIWCIYMLHGSSYPGDTIARIVVGNLFMTGWVADIGLQFNWYVQVIFWVYLLAPLFYKMIVAATKKWHYGVILLWALLLGVAFWCDDNHLLGVSRLPVFLLGMMWAHAGNASDKENTDGKPDVGGKNAILLILLAVAGMVLLLACYFNFPRETMWAYGLWWYPFLLITPGLCLVICLLLEAMDKVKGLRQLRKPLALLGTASFEIYLIHIAAFEIVPDYIWVTLNKRWLVLVLASILVGIGYHLLVECIMRKWRFK